MPAVVEHVHEHHRSVTSFYADELLDEANLQHMGRETLQEEEDLDLDLELDVQELEESLLVGSGLQTSESRPASRLVANLDSGE